MLRVYYRFTETLDGVTVAEMLGLLSTAERTRQARFVHQVDRRDFAAAHALLRHALSDNGADRPEDWIFDVNGFGKPALLPSLAARVPLAFNLAHTRGLVACAVTTLSTVGLDVEPVDREIRVDEIAADCFSSEDFETVGACSLELRNTRFTELWTLKEAYVKALGVGLSHPLKSFGFRFEGASSLQFSTIARGGAVDWQFLLFAPASRYRMAVAFPGHDAVGVETIEQTDVLARSNCPILRSTLIE